MLALQCNPAISFLNYKKHESNSLGHLRNKRKRNGDEF